MVYEVELNARDVADSKALTREFKGTSTTGPIGNLPYGDAYFIVSNRSPAYFQDSICMDAISSNEGLSHAVVLDIQFELCVNDTTYRAQMGAAKRIEEVQRWFRVICNQGYSNMVTVDLLKAHLRPNKAQEARKCLVGDESQTPNDRAIARLRAAVNAEQIRAIDSLQSARDSYAIIIGSAGTGKTHLQLALATFYASEGCRVLALSPANSNCDDFSNKLAAYRPFQELSQGIGGPQLIRLYPQSADHPQKSMVPGASKSSDTEEFFGDGLEAVLATHRLTEHLVGSHKAHLLGLQQRTINEAKAGKRQLFGRYDRYKFPNRAAGNQQGHTYGLNGRVDFWRELREYIQAVETGAFDHDDSEAFGRVMVAYHKCRAHLLQTSAVVSTTTTNAGCQLLKSTWYPNAEEALFLGRPKTYKGLVILVDEATKDQEINLLISMMKEEYHDKITAVIHFGDDKQLGPSNNAMRGPVQTVEFREYGDVSLPQRLIEEGFPAVTRLMEQCRMHATLSDFPSRAFYDGKLRNASHCFNLLKDTKRSLATALVKIVEKLGVTLNMDGDDRNNVDKVLRDLHVVVKGKCLMDPDTHSKVVLEVANFFSHHMWDALHGVYGHQTSNDVMVVCGYKETKSHWISTISRNMREKGLGREHFPSVHTIDGSQGQEATVVIIDTAIQEVNTRTDIGFLKDHGRANVALTRAKDCRIMIAGGYEGIFLEQEGKKPTSKVPVLVELYREQKREGHVLRAPDHLVQESQRPSHLVDA